MKSMLWGGLRPIPSRLFLDTLTIASLFYCALSSPHNAILNDAVLAFACLTTITTAGLTWRWTISFPLVPFLVLQGLRRIEFIIGAVAHDVDVVVAASSIPTSWTGVIIGTLSIILLLLSSALTILFPAVELGQIKGKYNVGIIDLHLPVDFTEGVRRGSLLGTQHQESNNDNHDDPSKSYVTARLLYPTNEAPEKFPYLDPQSAEIVCAELMKAGAPGPLKKFGWMLHTWRFTTIKAKRNALPCDFLGGGGRKFPLAVYSHGLTGMSAIYSYQALNLAASGMAVVMVDHMDESAIAVRRRDSSHLLYNPNLITELYNKGKEEEYEQKRKAQTNHRVEECLQALKVLKSLNRKNIPDLHSKGVSFVNKLNVSDVTMIGHSFGGCTAVAVAAQRPDLVSTVVAHEPALAWLPDDARRKLFPSEKEEEEKKDNDQEEGAEEIILSSNKNNKSSIHDINMLFLYSEEWANTGWGACNQVKSMHERNELGPKNGTSDYGVINKAKHAEFGDTCMLTPLWLARATGLTGKRNPIETAEEIAARTVDFLEVTRRKRR